MNLSDAQALAERLMQENGLTDYRFQFDSACRRFGYCSWSRKVISLSKVLVQLNGEEQVRQTIVHEIAHALTPGHHHDEVWKAVAIKLGDTGEKCYRNSEVIRPEPKHIYACSNCGLEFRRSKRILEKYGNPYHHECGPKLVKLTKVK